MKIYPPAEGFTAEDMRRGIWALHADVKCTDLDCAKEYSLANVGGIGGKCPRCGARCM